MSQEVIVSLLPDISVCRIDWSGKQLRKGDSFGIRALKGDRIQERGQVKGLRSRVDGT